MVTNDRMKKTMVSHFYDNNYFRKSWNTNSHFNRLVVHHFGQIVNNNKNQVINNAFLVNKK